MGEYNVVKYCNGGRSYKMQTDKLNNIYSSLNIVNN